MILVVGLAIQSATLALYLGAFDRAGARAILAAWRSSLFAGFMGALASQFWFIAFALTDAARVRTLALIEVPLAQLVSLKLFREPPSLRDGLRHDTDRRRRRDPRLGRGLDHAVSFILFHFAGILLNQGSENP